MQLRFERHGRCDVQTGQAHVRGQGFTRRQRKIARRTHCNLVQEPDRQESKRQDKKMRHVSWWARYVSFLTRVSRMEWPTCRCIRALLWGESSAPGGPGLGGQNHTFHDTTAGNLVQESQSLCQA